MNLRSRSFCSIFVFAALAAFTKPAQAQAQAPTQAGQAPVQAAEAPVQEPADPGKVTVTGRVETPEGPLGGAVVKLQQFKLSCVTNSEGLFFFSVPADAGTINAVAAFNGSTDVPFTIQTGGELTVVKMAVPTLAKKDKKQLKSSIKRAHREGQKSLRQIR